MSTLERAISTPAEAHAGQLDKAGAAHEAFVLRVGLDPIGLRVMLADLEDNCDLGRIPTPTQKDRERVARYRRAIAQLRQQVPKL